MQYIVSAKHDYEGYICDDAGPAFAADYGWPVRVVGRDPRLAGQPQIIDPLVFPDEQEAILAEIKDSKDLYLMRVTDPYWRPFHYAIAPLVLEAIKLPNVVLMLTYTPNEQTAYYLSIARNRSFVHAPYVYRKQNELPIGGSRREKVLLSGRLDKAIYPLRSNYWRATRVWFPLAMKTDLLPHPGYEADARSLSRTRSGYVQELAKYKFAFVCSARTRSEFLKYREIAYGGAVPVGDMPMTFNACPSTCYIPYIGGVRAITARIQSSDDYSGMAHEYRRFIAGQRDRSAMMHYVDEQITAI